MRERDYPKFASFPHHSLDYYVQPVNPVLPPDAWAKRLAELDQLQAAEIEQAIKEAAELQSDIHLYRKIGSRFIGIGFEPGNGPTVKVHEHPEIAA